LLGPSFESYLALYAFFVPWHRILAHGPRPGAGMSMENREHMNGGGQRENGTPDTGIFSPLRPGSAGLTILGLDKGGHCRNVGAS
jgi:hypothetical protein